MLTTDNRRRAQRFPLQLPLEVKWREASQDVQKHGTVRDISANGVFFQFDRALQPESKVEFYVRLELEGAPGGGVWLHCVGSVVRVEPSPENPTGVGVAARIERYRFLRPEEVPPQLDVQ